MKSGEHLDERRNRIVLNRPDTDNHRLLFGFQDGRRDTLDALSTLHVSIIASLFPDTPHTVVTRSTSLVDLHDELSARTQRLKWEAEARRQVREERAAERKRRKRAALEAMGALSKS